MANTDNPFGFRPVRYRSGAPYTGACNPYYVGTGDSVALFIGDPVVLVGNSNTAAEGDGRHAIGTLPVCARATAGDANPVCGIVVGVEFETRDSLVYRAASTERIIYVADDPELIFHVQDDGAGTPGATNAFTNANIVFTHSGDTVYGRSKAELNAASMIADQSFQLLMLGAARLPGNDAASDFCIWEVLLNTHQFKGGAVGTTLGITA